MEPCNTAEGSRRFTSPKILALSLLALAWTFGAGAFALTFVELFQGERGRFIVVLVVPVVAAAIATRSAISDDYAPEDIPKAVALATCLGSVLPLVIVCLWYYQALVSLG